MTDRVRIPPGELDEDGPRAEDVEFSVGDVVCVALRTDVEGKDRHPLRARRLQGRVAEVRGPESSVVVQLESGWCVNSGDRVIYHRRSEAGVEG